MRWIGFALLLFFAADVCAAPAEDHWGSASQTSSPAAYMKAKALIEAARYDEALPVLIGLSEEQPGFADAWSLLGFAYRKTGDLEQSGLAYRRALGMDPYHRGALEYQGELFLMLGEIAKAEANLARLDAICASQCEELDELAAEIAAWRAKNR